jgi:hypothetical protein
LTQLSGISIAKTAGTGTLTIEGNGRLRNQGSITASGTGKLHVVMISEMDDSSTISYGGLYNLATGAIATNGGDLWLGGGAKTNVWKGLAVGIKGSVGNATYNGIDVSGNISTSGGDVMMLAFVGTAATGIGYRDIAATGGNRTINSGSGDITFLTRYPSYDYQSNKLTLTSTGHLTLAPLSGATYFTSAINLNGTTTGGTLTGANDLGGLVINNVANLTGLTLGNYLGSGVAGDTAYVYANTSTMTLSAPFSIAGPISVYGSNINVNANLNTTAGGSSGDILLKASGNIELAASKTITTNGGDVVLWSNSDGGADTGSVLLRDGSSITTSGGHLWAGGGSGSTTWNGLTVGNGYAVAGTTLTPASCACLASSRCLFGSHNT